MKAKVWVFWQWHLVGVSRHIAASGWSWVDRMMGISVRSGFDRSMLTRYAS